MIGNDDLTLLRSENQYVQPVINRWEKQVVATGTISQTPKNYPIGRVNLTWDTGDYTKIRVGQMYEITTALGNLVTFGIVRKTPTNTICYIDGKAQGDAGRATLQTVSIQSGQTITVYSIQPLWSLLSRIKNGVFYKKFDIEYDGSGSNPLPVVNIGKWRQVWADAITGLGRVSFNNDNSFTWLNKTITDYEWTLPDNSVIISGAVDEASIEIDLPQGFHIIKCKLTDSGNAEKEAIRPIWVNGDDYPPFSELYGIEISGDSQDRKGRNISLKVYGGDFDDWLMPVNAFCMTEIARFNGESVSNGVLVDTFVGYSKDDTTNYDLLSGERAIEMDVSGPFAWLEAIPMVSQAIVEVDNPIAWTDIAKRLGTPDFMGWYILNHHSCYLDLFDYMPLREVKPNGKADNVRKLNWGFNGSVMAEYLTQLASVIRGNIGCTSDGSLYLRRDPNIEYDNYRDNLENRMTLTVDETTGVCDIVEPVSYPHTFLNTVSQVKVFALMYEGGEVTAVGAIAPGYQQGQATGSSDETNMIIKKPLGENVDTNDPNYRLGGQDAVNMIAGHIYAQENSPIKDLSLSLNRNLDVFEPAKMQWVSVSIPSHWSAKNVVINTRALPVSIERAWEVVEGGFIKNINMSVQPETYGQPGVVFTTEKGKVKSQTPTIPPIESIEDNKNGIDAYADFFLAISSDGILSRTFDGSAWEDMSFNILEELGETYRFEDFAINPYSSIIASGYASGTLSAWCALSVKVGGADYDTLQIWYASDVYTQYPEWTLQYEFDFNDSIQSGVRMRANPNTENHVVVTVWDGTDSYMMRTVDGSNWSKTDFGDTPPITIAPNNPMDFGFIGESMFVSAYVSGDSGFKIGKFTDKNDTTWSSLSSSPVGYKPIPFIECDNSNDRLYCTISSETLEASGVSDTIEFEEQALAISPFFQYVTRENGSTSDWIAKFERFDNTGDTYITSSGQMYAVADTISGLGYDIPNSYSNNFYESIDQYAIWAFKLALKGKPLGISVSYFAGVDDGTEILFPLRFSIYGYGDNGQLKNSVMTRYLSGNPSAYSEMKYEYGVDDICSEQYPNWIFTVSDEDEGVPISGTPSYKVSHPVRRMYTGDGERPMLRITIEGSITVQSDISYRVDSATTSPSFTSILSSAFTYHPLNPEALSIDSTDSDVLNGMFGTPGGVGGSGIYAHYRSTDAGDNWTLVEDTVSMLGIKQTRTYGYRWGYNSLQYTEDDYANIQSIYGNWDISISPDGYIKSVKGIF